MRASGYNYESAHPQTLCLYNIANYPIPSAKCDQFTRYHFMLRTPVAFLRPLPVPNPYFNYRVQRPHSITNLQHYILVTLNNVTIGSSAFSLLLLCLQLVQKVLCHKPSLNFSCSSAWQIVTHKIPLWRLELCQPV